MGKYPNQKKEEYIMCHKENCFQCVIDEVDTKLEDLLNSVKGHHLKKLEDRIVAIRDEIHPLVSC